jgi:hypothetical protein
MMTVGFEAAHLATRPTRRGVSAPWPSSPSDSSPPNSNRPASAEQLPRGRPEIVVAVGCRGACV